MKHQVYIQYVLKEMPGSFIKVGTVNSQENRFVNSKSPLVTSPAQEQS